MNNKLQTLSERILYALEITGMTQTQLAKEINISKQAVQYLCSKPINKSKYIYDIASVLNVNLDWLSTGSGSIFTNESPEQSLFSTQQLVPVLTWDQITSTMNVDELIANNEIIEWSTASIDLSNQTFCFRLRDQSMFPKFNEGSIVTVDPSLKAVNKKYVLTLLPNSNEPVFRKLIFNNTGYTLQTENSEHYKDIYLEKLTNFTFVATSIVLIL